MTSKKYQEAPPIAREDAERAFSCDLPEKICDALVRVALNDPDWRWVQEKCLYFINSPSPDVRRLAVICFGHLARIHGKLDLKRVLPVLEGMRDDHEIYGSVEDALEDIEAFTGGSPTL